MRTCSRRASRGAWDCSCTSGDGSTRPSRRTTGRDENGEPRDVALLLAWRASAHWLRADADACRADAKRAYNVASEANDPQALAAAHTVLAMLAALEGDRGANDAHYLRALEYAQQAGDVLQLIRVRTNRGSRHVEECSYEEAISELDLALRLADLAGFAAFRALALSNRGEALAKLGRFEEAIADLDASRALYQRLGSRMVAYPLDKLGEVYRVRGDSTLARAAFEEAVAQADAAGDVQGLVPSLTGLARVLVVDEPEEARRLVDRALSLGPGLTHAHALLAAGWVALVRGERERAVQLASEAAAGAGVRRDRAALAESLELRALASRELPRDVERLGEAAAIWRELGNPAGEARAELVAALLSGDTEAAERAEASLAAVGARGLRSRLALVLPLDNAPPVVVQALGRFRVLRGGEPVALGAWQSRKARDLLKMLVARRGRPTPRDVLMEALWPEQSPGPLGNRLSVLLSTVRGVLDPEKRFEQDHFVGADKSAVWLETENLALDVDAFLSGALDALALQRANSPEAPARLAAAEARVRRGLPRGGRLRGLGDRAPRGGADDLHRGRSRARRRCCGPWRRGRHDAFLPARARARSVRRACSPRPRLGARVRRAARRGAPLLPGVLRADGRDRRRIGAVPFPRRRTLTPP